MIGILTRMIYPNEIKTSTMLVMHLYSEIEVISKKEKNTDEHNYTIDIEIHIIGNSGFCILVVPQL